MAQIERYPRSLSFIAASLAVPPTAGTSRMAVKTTVTELPDSRVRLDAEVPERGDRVAPAAHRGRSSGATCASPASARARCPAPMVIQRIGREAVLEQAVRDSLPEWYEEAIVRSGVSTVGDPKLDLDDLPSAGEALSFSIEVGGHAEGEPRRRTRSSRSASARPRSPTRRSSSELDRLRESFARARERRPAGRAGRPPRDGLRRPRRRRAVQGRRGARLHARDRRRAADRGLRGAARRRARRRGSARSRSTSPTSTTPRSCRAATPCSTCRSRT